MASRAQTPDGPTDNTQAKPKRDLAVNRVILVGRLVAKPELRTTSSGTSVTTVRVVTNDREQPEFHDVVLWRAQAEFACQYMAKGRLAYIEGRLQSRTWEGTDGTTRRTVEVLADRFQALSSKPAVAA
ncbi:MAG TPA: single-stranded DNA-binding protein [Acidimicrobiales bacterium]|nr:single-stranded DNA-binding protein [Acidimicrobiales bacterium]